MQTVTLKREVVDYIIPVCTVVQVTDTTTGQIAEIGRSLWLSEEHAIEYAQTESAKHPAPQRFWVKTPDWALVGIWQCGERVPLFEIV